MCFPIEDPEESSVTKYSLLLARELADSQGRGVAKDCQNKWCKFMALYNV